MIKTSLIVLFALAVKLSTCTKEGSPATIFDLDVPTQMIFCVDNGITAASVLVRQLPRTINAIQDDFNKQKNLFRELQDQWHYGILYKNQALEWEKFRKVWSTLKTDSDSLMKRLHYTRITVWLEGLEAFFFPIWLAKAKNFNRYEKWLIGCSTCQEERWKIFKQAINDKYGNSTKEGTIALAKAISDLYSEVSSEIPYYNAMSMRAPETDREITDLCSVVGEPTTMKHLACKLVLKAQNSAGDYLLTIKHTVEEETIAPNRNTCTQCGVRSTNFRSELNSSKRKVAMTAGRSIFTTETPALRE